MKTRRWIFPAAAALLLSGQAYAQGEPGAAGSATAEAGAARIEEQEAAVERELREAEERMAEAARRISELTARRLPEMRGVRQQFEFISDGRPRLGVMIGGDGNEPVEGVRIVGVTPGSAAAEAGLRSGDVITSINGESLSASDSGTANERLLDFMRGVEDGDMLDIEYLRDGKVGKVEVEPTVNDNTFFAFAPGGGPLRVPGIAGVPGVHVAPAIPGNFDRQVVFDWIGGGWADMELVELNEGLGRYFGTAEGLLVVRAPVAGSLGLQDGDVIQKIDGRTPSSARHAMRILASYQAGEKLTLEIMRDRKRQTLDVEIPDDRTGRLAPDSEPVVRPAAAPAKPAAPAPGRSRA